MRIKEKFLEIEIRALFTLVYNNDCGGNFYTMINYGDDCVKVMFNKDLFKITNLECFDIIEYHIDYTKIKLNKDIFNSMAEDVLKNTLFGTYGNIYTRCLYYLYVKFKGSPSCDYFKTIYVEYFNSSIEDMFEKISISMFEKKIFEIGANKYCSDML